MGSNLYKFRADGKLSVYTVKKEEIENSLSDSQKEEVQRAATFAELRTAKSAEISEGEKLGGPM